MRKGYIKKFFDIFPISIRIYGIIGTIKIYFAHALKMKYITVKLAEFDTVIKFRPFTGDYVTTRQVLWEERAQLKYNKAPKWIIDLGANIGISTLALKHRYPSATIIALEPDIDNFHLLEYNTKDMKNIIRINKAIWHKKEFLSLTNAGCLSNSYIYKNTDSTENSNLTEVETMSSIMESYNIDFVDILKVDIEGTEKEIFLDTDVDWIDKINLISIEFHDNKTAELITELLIKKNFEETLLGEKHIFRKDIL